MKLFIGYKNYSSWSLRPWLMMRVGNLDFEETVLPFYHDDSLRKLATRLNVPAQVPILEHAGITLWDSLAIAEYLAEQHLDKGLWPKDPTLRSLARCAAAEMHSGFNALRAHCPMNCRARKRIDINEAMQADLQRLASLWDVFAQTRRSQATQNPGDFLCGQFGIVDAMFAPIAVRTVGYSLAVSEQYTRWTEALYQLPAMKEWLAAAEQEAWQIEQYDGIGEPLSS